MARGLTLADCAKGVGTTRQVWHAWETGKRRPHSRYMPRVREFTDGAIGADAFYPEIKSAA